MPKPIPKPLRTEEVLSNPAKRGALMHGVR